MSGDDRLSSLPDDLLHRVLHFAPAREAESTSALSKRWRGLWRSSGAVNLEERVVGTKILDDERFFSRRDAFISAARLSLEAAAAAGSPATRLTFRVEAAAGGHDRVYNFLYHEPEYRRRNPDVVAELLSLPAARRVQELRLAPGYSGHHISSDREREVTSLDTAAFSQFTLISLPMLRVLDITSGYLGPSAGVAFPRLASLRLSFFSVQTEHLQALIHAAPALGTICLESVMFHGGIASPEQGLTIIRLHCPAATTLVLDRCCWEERPYGSSGDTTAVEMDAPRLRRFTYKGLLRPLSLSSQAPDLARADLQYFPHVYHGRYRDPCRDVVTFWQLARNFSNAKELKLSINFFGSIATTLEKAQLMCSFRNLERLELGGLLTETTVASILHCCPVLRDFRIYITTPNANRDRAAYEGRTYLEKKHRHDLNNSIRCFENRTSKPMVSAEMDYDDDDVRYFDNLPELPALSGHAFRCLQSSLSCVRLQFRLETNIFGVKSTNIFGVQLIKFFAENAMVLKEMHIDAGNDAMCGHINCKVEKWVANSSGKTKMSFLVLPLER